MANGLASVCIMQKDVGSTLSMDSAAAQNIYLVDVHVYSVRLFLFVCIT